MFYADGITEGSDPWTTVLFGVVTALTHTHLQLVMAMPKDDQWTIREPGTFLPSPVHGSYPLLHDLQGPLPHQYLPPFFSLCLWG